MEGRSQEAEVCWSTLEQKAKTGKEPECLTITLITKRDGNESARSKNPLCWKDSNYSIRFFKLFFSSMISQAADPVWGYPDLRSEAGGHWLTRALGQDCDAKRLWAKGLQDGRQGHSRIAGIWHQQAESHHFSHQPSISVVMAEHKAGFACARRKPPHETKTTAEVSEQHLSATPVSTSTSLHHARSNLLRDDPLIKDTCIEHKRLMFAGDAVQSSKYCLRKPRPWDLASGKMLLLHMQFHTSLHRSCDSPARAALCHRRNTCAQAEKFNWIFFMDYRLWISSYILTKLSSLLSSRANTAAREMPVLAQAQNKLLSQYWK